MSGGFECEVGGVKVEFPFEPYDVQLELMTKVVECLDGRRHGVLESPTGTGKTLSLLCAVLGWLQRHKLRLRQEGAEGSWACGKVVYASRTHSQLRQVVRQFQTTVYRHLFRPTVIGSRDHMCINNVVRKETSLSHKNMRCSLLVKQKQCRFYHNVKNAVQGLGKSGVDVMEELGRPDASKTCCPYYLTREAVPSSDIIFMPYNYLMDMQLHRSFKFSLADCVIIVDEGHNVGKVCEEASSVVLSAANVACCVQDLAEEMQAVYDASSWQDMDEEREYTPDDLVFLQQRLTALDSLLAGMDPPQDGMVHRGAYMFDLLAQCQVTEETKDRLVEMLAAVGDGLAARQPSSSFSNKGLSLKRLSDSLRSIFTSLESSNLTDVDLSYKVFIERDRGDYATRNKKKMPIIVNYWCFNPGFLLKRLLDYNLRSIIITSGTLSPVEAMVQELGLVGAVTMSSRHVIKPFQVSLCTLPKGPMNYELKCTYATREDSKYWRELGTTVQNLARQIPHGLLIFFPSYTTLKKAQEEWSNGGLLARLSAVKTVFVEPNNKEEMEEVLSNYSLAVDNNPGGAILIGVCRGKISEGLDFSGKYARAVLITGIPYAPPKDRRVQLKKEFIDSNRALFQGLTGDIWYQIDAMRAVNQALGRAVRHCSDYGIILLCDSRFHRSTSADKRLPAWLRPYLVPCDSFGVALTKVKSFFKGVEENKHLLVAPSSRDVPEDAIIIQDEDKCLSSRGNVGGFTSLTESMRPHQIEQRTQTGARVAPAASFTPMAESTQSAGSSSLRHESLFNRAVLDTQITRDTALTITPAKRRRIVISSRPALDDLRKSDVKSFILDVKLTLDPDSYATFAFIVKKYSQTDDFDGTVEALRTLFTSGDPPDPSLVELYRGCHRVFSERHRSLFLQSLDPLPEAQTSGSTMEC